jgi:hypothetical protein
MTLSAPGPRRSWLLAKAILIGHYVEPFAHLIVLGIGASLISRLWVDEVGWVVAALHTTALFTLGAAYVCNWIHSNHLCDRDELGFLDPQAAVEKHRGQLRLYHRRGVGILIGLSMLALAIPPMKNEWPLWLRVLLTAAIAACAVSTMVFDRATSVHQKLHLWCPWRPRYRGEGDDETTPAPQPQPTGSVNG